METINNSAVNGTATQEPNGKPELSNFVVTGNDSKDEKGKTPESKTDVTPKPVKPVKPKEEKPVLTIQARLKKLDNLNQLLEKRKLLVENLDDVNAFTLAPNGHATLVFTDSKRNSFTVSNANVIAEMVELAKKRLDVLIEQLDEQIVF